MPLLLHGFESRTSLQFERVVMKIDLNADYRSVCNRLAEKKDAGVAQLGEPLIRNEEVVSSILTSGPKLNAERERM